MRNDPVPEPKGEPFEEHQEVCSQIGQIQECERAIAQAVPRFIDLEKALSEEGQTAADMGVSMLSALLLGLMHPTTPEGKSAIELAYFSDATPSTSEGINECLSTFGSIPESSKLPEAVAKEIERGEPLVDTMEYDLVGDRLKFFRGASRAQIELHLIPLTSSHKHESIRDRIRETVEEICPELFPLDKYSEDLRAFSKKRGELSWDERSAAKNHIKRLGESSLPNEELTTFFGELLTNVLRRKAHWSVRVLAEELLHVINTRGLHSPTISAAVENGINAALKDLPNQTIAKEFFIYQKQVHGEKFENLIVRLVQAHGRKFHKQDWLMSMRYALEEVDTLEEASSVKALGEFMLRGNYIDGFTSLGSLVADRIANSPHLETKGEIAEEFLLTITQQLERRYGLKPGKYRIGKKS